MGWAKRLAARKSAKDDTAKERGQAGGLAPSKPAPGSIQKVRESDLGDGRRLVVHKLTPPQDPDIISLMGQAKDSVDHGFEERAAALAHEIWRRAPGDKFVEVWAGQMLAKHGDRERAVEVYCASEGLPLGSWEAYWQLGVFLCSCGEHARAVEFLEEAVRIEPRAVDALLDLARGLTALGRRGEAKRWLILAQQMKPEAQL